MKLKLDENIRERGAQLLRSAGHDVATVKDEKLVGAKDEELFSVCSTERRALVTLDRDFGHVLRFPPSQSAGIIVLEVTPRADRDTVVARIKDLIVLLQTHALGQELWIIEPGRLRVRQTS